MPPTKDQLAASFEQAWRCSSPELVHDLCYFISEEFAQQARAAGYEAEVISGCKAARARDLPFGWNFEGEVLLQGHFAVLMEDEVWDWTARQFDPEAPVPLIQPLEEWRSSWPETGRPAVTPP